MFRWGSAPRHPRQQGVAWCGLEFPAPMVQLHTIVLHGGEALGGPTVGVLGVVSEGSSMSQSGLL